jgi:hypothetical protein
MATVEERYQVAIAYAERAIAAVEKGPSTWNPITLAIESYAGGTKTEQVRNDLRHIQDRWKAARSDADRATIARDAELLADRTQESLPGAPQDRQRTNLWKGEKPTSTPATSYGGEAKQQAEDSAAHAVRWVRAKAKAVRDEIDHPWGIGKWLLIGGGVVVAWSLLRPSGTDRRQSQARTLNRRLAEVANEERGDS